LLNLSKNSIDQTHTPNGIVKAKTDRLTQLRRAEDWRNLPENNNTPFNNPKYVQHVFTDKRKREEGRGQSSLQSSLPGSKAVAVSTRTMSVHPLSPFTGKVIALLSHQWKAR